MCKSPDYTERAREIVDKILHLHDRQADEGIRRRWARLVVDALSAVASERDAEIHEMQHDIDRYAAHVKAALLARLREPDVRGTAAKRVADYRQHGCHWALGTCTECQGIADAALTKIAEMLK